MLGAALCFYAGYTVGQKKPRAVVRENPVVMESSPGSNREAMLAQSPSLTEPEPADDAPSPPVEASTLTPAVFEARAQEPWITFTDTTGRSLVAEILKVESASLKIRREADRRVLTLPVDMLSDEDQAFAAFLWQQQQNKERSQLSDEEMLRRLFENF